jgi:hypothetical protein
MEIRVECYAGYRGEQEPRAFWLGKRRIAALEILDRWMAPDHRYFKIRGDDGHIYVLRNDEKRSEWTLGAFTRASEAAAPAANGPQPANAGPKVAPKPRRA